MTFDLAVRRSIDMSYVSILFPGLFYLGRHGFQLAERRIQLLTARVKLSPTTFVALMLIGVGIVFLVVTIPYANWYGARTNNVHVKTAEWLNQYALKGSKVAVGEIGVIGSDSELWVIDLVGLVTPETSSLRTEAELVEYLFQSCADYWVVTGDFSFAAHIPRLIAEGRISQLASFSYATRRYPVTRFFERKYPFVVRTPLNYVKRIYAVYSDECT
jgi:hypothetical protein